MNSDSAFYIGKTHHVCQDYATHNLDNAIISDGCSSSPDTDWGSRLITLACLEQLKSKSSDNLIENFIYPAYQNVLALNLPINCLDATLLFVRLNDNKYHFRSFGDGIFAKVRKDGAIEISEIEYLSGAPFYLSYQLSEERRKQYLNKFGYYKIIKQYTIQNGEVKSFLVTESDDPSIIGFTENGSSENYLCLAVISDGALSFQQTIATETSKSIVPVKVEILLTELLGFKNYFGSFVQRRVQAFRKECDKRSWFPTDDVSIGAVYCGP